VGRAASASRRTDGTGARGRSARLDRRRREHGLRGGWSRHRGQGAGDRPGHRRDGELQCRQLKLSPCLTRRSAGPSLGRLVPNFGCRRTVKLPGAGFIIRSRKPVHGPQRAAVRRKDRSARSPDAAHVLSRFPERRALAGSPNRLSTTA
jgi:hypothetical protein